MRLNEKQKKVVFDLEGNTIVSASPGTGKTRTLVARADYKLNKIKDYQNLALITYTNAAADEISSRMVNSKNVFIGTIHSFCLEYILRPFSWIYKWKRPKVVSYEQLVNFFSEHENISLSSNPFQNQFDELGKIKKDIEGKLDRTVEWEHEMCIEEVAEIYFNYLDELKAIDFNEILYRSYKLINENNFIAKSISSKFYEILVDEFQDTNIFQYEIFRIISEQGRCTFFMVGDERQKIFSFAGSISESFSRAEKEFNAKHEELNETYRSTNNIVNTYTKLFKTHPTIINQSEYKDIDIDVTYCETCRSNHNETISEIIKFLLEEGIPRSEIAILSTSYFSAFPVSKYLRRNYRIVGLGALPHKSINNSTFGLLKSLARYYVFRTISSLRRIRRNFDLHLLDNDLTLEDVTYNAKINKLIIEFQNLSTDINIQQGIENVKTLFDSIFDLDHSSFEEINELIDDAEKPLWTLENYLFTIAGVEGITCNTIHKTKGLEFDAVILNNMNENKIPYQKMLSRNPWIFAPLSEESIEEGRKVFYVAVSRARKYLFILYNFKPSLFINDLKT